MQQLVHRPDLLEAEAMKESYQMTFVIEAIYTGGTLPPPHVYF